MTSWAVAAVLAMLGSPPLARAAEAASAPVAAAADWPSQPTDDDLVEEKCRESQDLLRRYRRRARGVYLGRILSVHAVEEGELRYERIELEVEETLRGRHRAVLAARVPVAHAPGAQTLPTAIQGYRALVFLDKDGWIIDGTGLYAVAGPLAWRSTARDHFMRPDLDRDWVADLTPGPEWVRLELSEVRAAF